MTKRMLAMAGFVALLCGCERDPGPLHFETTAKDLNFLSSYTGRLALRDNCVVLVTGPDMIAAGEEVSEPQAIALPLFNDGFEIEGTGGGYSITTPEGEHFEVGDIVTGEGGPFPIKPLDPRSAPVNDPPDTAPCTGVLTQVNSMYRSEVERRPE